jgi:hypothetical protein
MGRECRIGFAELFRLARKREWTPEEERRFQALDQEARNEMVRQLGREAGGVRTEDRRGTDGKVYTAFWVEEPSD